MKRIFISYSRRDLEFVERLARDLQQAGHEVWYDLSRLEGGDRWGRELQNAIHQSQVFLLVVSPNSVESKWVEKEFLYASNLNLRIVPLMYRTCELPLWLLGIQYIDVQGGNYSRKFPQILRALTDNNGVHVGGDGTGNDAVQSEGNGRNVGAKETPQPTRKKHTKKPGWRKLITPVIVALIILVGAIIAALLNSTWNKDLVTPTPVPSSIPTIYVTDTQPVIPVAMTLVTDTPVVTPTLTLTPTYTLTPTDTLTPTLENTSTASPSPEPRVDKLTAILTANLYEGKAPLRITFDARASYIQFVDGRTAACANTGFCWYTFTIYRDSRWLDTFHSEDGILSYTFGGKGKYAVAVYVCREQACGDDGVDVVLR